MKNKKGFTLVELLAVIVILGILSSIAVIASLKIKKEQDKNNAINMISGILTGAKRYVTDNPNKDINIADNELTINDLVNNKYTNVDITELTRLLGASENDEVKYSVCIDDDGNPTIKRAFYITISGNTYNDCGCAQQQSSTKAAKVCSGMNGTNEATIN